MPSVSKKQQKFMGIVRSIQKGEQPAGKFSKDAQDAAKKMKKSSVKKYAKTKHDDLPTKKEGVNKFKKLPGKVVAKRMMSIKSLKPYASMIAKKKSVSTIDLERELPYDKVSVKDIDKVMKESLSKSQIKKMRDEFDKTGELPPHLKKVVKGKKEFEKKFKVKDIVIPGMEWMSKLGEERDYKDEYKKFQSSTKSKKYRAELNKYNRKKGTYGNGDGKDASHKGGKIVGFEKESKNRGRAEKSRLKKENNMPDFNPIIDEVLDEVFGEYQMNENSKVLKSIENLAKQNKYGNVTGTKMNGKTANLVMKIYNHPKMKKYQKAMEKYTSDELVDMTLKMPKVLGIKENVDEALDPYKDFDGSPKEEYNLNLGAFVEHYQDFIKFMKKHKEVPDKNKREWALAIRNKVGRGMFNGHMSQMSNIMDLLQMGDKFRNLKESVNERDNVGMAYKHTLAKVELKKIKDAILMFQKKIKKQGRVTNARDEDHLKNLIKVYKQMGGKGVKESVNEGQKKQASMILRKFDMAFIKFSREIRDVIEMVDRSTGSKVDGKIIEKAYEKGLIPLNKIMIEWDRGQQENPGLSEDETLEGLGDKFGKKLDKYNKKNKKSKDALKKYAKLKKK
jgi:hypothetical protein